MNKQQVKQFREHYFPEKTITKSRTIMCKKFGMTERCARSWEDGDRPISNLFIKASKDFDKDGILKQEN